MALGCDISEFRAAAERLSERLASMTAEPTPEWVRSQIECLPPIKITMNGKVIDKLYATI